MYAKTSKIDIAILISVIISFSVFLIFMNYANPIVLAENNFYSKEFSDDKKIIFILGSSYIGQIDTNKINSLYLNATNEYEVYNLSIHSDQPKKRIKIIEKVISLKPNLIIYGIGFNDLGIYEPKSSPIDIKEFFSNSFTLEEIWNIRQSPKDITLDVILNVITHSSFSSRDEYNPFYPQKIPVMSKIRTNDEFQKIFDDNIVSVVDHIPEFNKNENAIALDKIIQKVKNNNIEIIIFSAPYNKIYLEEAGSEKIENFRNLLNFIGNSNNVLTFDFLEKYAELDIWADPSHVAYNNNKTMIYSQDITKIIQEEIEN